MPLSDSTKIGLKATYIFSIKMWNQRSVATIETPNPFDDSYEFVINPETVSQSEVPDVLSVIDKSNNMITLQQPTPQQPTHQQAPNQKHSASIVVLIPLILLTVAVILIKIGSVH